MTTSSLRVGIDLVQVSRIEESLARFGDRFLQRVFTSDEIAYATVRDAAHRLGAGAFSLSVSHEGDYATAVVITSVQPTH